MPGWRRARKPIADYLRTLSGYRKNTHRIDPEIIDIVDREWGFAVEAWGERAGRRQLVEQLFDQHVGVLRLFLRGWPVSQEETEDVVQELFTRLMALDRLEQKMADSTRRVRLLRYGVAVPQNLDQLIGRLRRPAHFRRVGHNSPNSQDIVRIRKSLLRNMSAEYDICRFLDLKLRAFDVVGKTGFEKRQRCTANPIARRRTPGRCRVLLPPLARVTPARPARRRSLRPTGFLQGNTM